MKAIGAGVTADFENRYGYPPGENTVRTPAAAVDKVLVQRALGIEAEHVLARFYGACDGMELGDFHNGLFLHPLRQVVEFGVLHLVGAVDTSVAVIGSDGGGTLIAASLHAQAPVYRCPLAGMRPGGYVADARHGFRQIDATLSLFLDRVLREFAAFAATGASPSFF